MVRSNELGCRNGWNADLWVPAVSDGSSERAQPHEAIAGRAASEVGPAEQNDLITSIVAAKTDNHALLEEAPRSSPSPPRATIEEDIFVGQTPSLTWSTGPISSQPATELVQNPKAAILRARDQYRQRRKLEGRLADREIHIPSAPLLASSREARSIAEREVSDLETEPQAVDPHYENRPLLHSRSSLTYEDRRPVSPVKLQEIERPFPSMTDFPEDRARFESVPQLGEANDISEFDDYAEDDTWIETRQLDTVPSEPYLIDEFFEEVEVVTFEEPAFFDEELSVPHRESTLNRLLRQRRERRQAPDHQGEHLDGGLPQRVAQILPDPESLYVEPTRRAVHQPQFESPPSPKAPVPSEVEDDFVLPPPLPEFQPRETVKAASHSSARVRQRDRAEVERSSTPRERIEPPAADEFGDQPLFSSNAVPAVVEDYEIVPSYDTPESVPGSSYRMERICQTCRDFRPTDNGERGWCNNKWAFNHRRMVDADDLGCRNSLGSWWTPKDDIWRRDGDISRHAQQTPRVDQWLFGINSDELGRRRSGS